MTLIYKTLSCNRNCRERIQCAETSPAQAGLYLKALHVTPTSEKASKSFLLAL